MAKVKRYGWKRPSLPQIHPFKYFPVRGLTALPSSVNLQSQCPAVYDQADLGSCTANAGAALAEFLTKKAKLPDFIPSRLAIYFWERVDDGDVNEDAGSSLHECMHVLTSKGAPHESIWPYNISKFKVKPPSNVVADGAKHKVGQALSITQDLFHLKSCLAEGYPFIFGFTVYESFESDTVAKTGIMPMPKAGEQIMGGHAVMAVGYDDVKQMFKVRNSWGNWGLNGYFWMPYSFILNSGYADDFWCAHSIK
jgi:C1A family cysteine protease